MVSMPTPEEFAALQRALAEALQRDQDTAKRMQALCGELRVVRTERDLLQEHIENFAEQHNLDPGALAPLLIDIAVNSRMLDYMMGVSKPSGSGLKLDLERMQREVDDFIRECRRHADEFVAESKQMVEDAKAQLASLDDDEEPASGQ